MALQNLQQYGCQTGNKLKEKSSVILLLPLFPEWFVPL
jgi:hypothetical protein